MCAEKRGSVVRAYHGAIDPPEEGAAVEGKEGCGTDEAEDEDWSRSRLQYNFLPACCVWCRVLSCEAVRAPAPPRRLNQGLEVTTPLLIDRKSTRTLELQKRRGGNAAQKQWGTHQIHYTCVRSVRLSTTLQCAWRRVHSNCMSACAHRVACIVPTGRRVEGRLPLAPYGALHVRIRFPFSLPTVRAAAITHATRLSRSACSIALAAAGAAARRTSPLARRRATLAAASATEWGLPVHGSAAAVRGAVGVAFAVQAVA